MRVLFRKNMFSFQHKISWGQVNDIPDKNHPGSPESAPVVARKVSLYCYVMTRSSDLTMFTELVRRGPCRPEICLGGLAYLGLPGQTLQQGSSRSCESQSWSSPSLPPFLPPCPSSYLGKLGFFPKRVCSRVSSCNQILTEG